MAGPGEIAGDFRTGFGSMSPPPEAEEVIRLAESSPPNWPPPPGWVPPPPPGWIPPPTRATNHARATIGACLMGFGVVFLVLAGQTRKSEQYMLLGLANLAAGFVTIVRNIRD